MVKILYGVMPYIESNMTALLNSAFTCAISCMCMLRNFYALDDGIEMPLRSTQS
jgi:hypothetical protein